MHAVCFALLLFIVSAIGAAQQTQTGTLRGQVKDEFGGVVVGANVVATVAGGGSTDKATTTDAEGNFTLTRLPVGKYTLRVVSPGFALYENNELEVTAGRSETVAIVLGVSLEKEEVTIASEAGIDTSSESNANSIVLRGKDIEALPDDPEDLAAALSALAGPSAGPNGGQIYVDGFEGGRMPPKETIREVRISQNPLNAENDRPGFGRIEILTRPGMDRIRGSASTTFGDEALNSRNPFSPTRADYQSRIYGFNLSGPVIAKKASFFVDFQRRGEDDNDVITATLLDPTTLAETSFNQAVLTPRRFTTISPRFDYAINQNHTLVARYTYSRSSNLGGIGGYNLLSRAVEFASTDHNVQLTETAILSPTFINETRFQYTHSRREQTGDNSLPTTQVLDSFTSGGASIGLSFNNERRWELQNYSTHTRGAHVLKFGVRLRGVRLTDFADNNFNGTATVAGGFAPRLDANNDVVIGADGLPILDPITSLQRLQRTLDLQDRFSGAALILRGGGASQFTIAGGEPEARVNQLDAGFFFQDEWRLRPNITLSLGVRYENQSNINSKFNFAPRIFFAWAPGGSTTGSMMGGPNQPKFVIRAGYGMFYDRFNENGTLQAIRFGVGGQERFVVDDPDVLGRIRFDSAGVIGTVPSVDDLVLQSRATTRVSDDLQAPRSSIAAVQVERQFPKNWTAYVVFFNFHTERAFRQRNINACLPETFIRNVRCDRPIPEVGDIYQFESTGTFNDNRLQIGVRNQLRPGFSIFANYNTGKATSDTDCVFGGFSGCFPANSYDLSGETGRVAFFSRHQVFIGGNFIVPKLMLSVSPFITGRTGQFFNITTGLDRNGDGIFNDRPAFADAQTPEEDLRRTQWGDFDVRPKTGQTIIPRNLGEGPSIFTINLGISRTFTFGEMPGAAAAAPAAAGSPARPGATQAAGGAAQGGGGAPAARAAGPGGPGGPAGSGPRVEKRYSLTFSVNIQNVLNHVNLASPVGNLSSPFFGESTRIVGPFGGFGATAGGNRKISGTVRFNF
jgi:hypothetical protein